MCFTPPGQPASPRASFIRPGGIRRKFAPRSIGSSTSRTKTLTGAPPTSAGSRATAIIVYGPLLAGATTVMYEGAPDFPQPDRFWRMIAKYRVNILYTSPTAIRAFIKSGEQWPTDTTCRACGCWARSANRSIRRLGSGITGDRGRELSDSRHLVADGNRLHHAFADAGSHADEAWVGDLPAAGYRRRRGRHGRQLGRPRR